MNKAFLSNKLSHLQINKRKEDKSLLKSLSHLFTYKNLNPKLQKLMYV
jgi:hypothetical protein